MGGSLSYDKLSCTYRRHQDDNSELPKVRHEEQAKKKRLLTCALVKEKEKHLRQCLKKLKTFNKLQGLQELKQLILSAWDPGTLGHGRDFAEALLEILAHQGGLKDLVTFISSRDEELQLEAARVLELSLTVKNRERVAEMGLKSIVDLCGIEDNEELKDCGIGLIEHMFKVSEGVCSQVIRLGGLEAVLYSCRSSNPQVCKHCAKALAYCAMFGGRANQKQMIRLNAHQWLFTLAFSGNTITSLYACLAIIFLGLNQEVQQAVEKSGTLNLVEIFVRDNDPVEFSQSDETQKQGRSQSWLKQLVKMLSSQHTYAQSLAAFLFAVEAEARQKQGTLLALYQAGAILPLKLVASSVLNETAANLAVRALETMGEHVPGKLSLELDEWSCEDVSTWLTVKGFDSLQQQFAQIDGRILLSLTPHHLEYDLGLVNGIQRERFLSELSELKSSADYSSCDHDGIADFLAGISKEFVQYTYFMISAGVTHNFLPHLTDDILLRDCHIENGVHRARILKFIQDSDGKTSSPDNQENEDRNSTLLVPMKSKLGSLSHFGKYLDVFISYRRSTGAQLASLLKVHLQLRGFSVFLDVDKLEAGQFPEKLLMNVKCARNFILVVTEGALDNCIGDSDCSDWIHKEVLTALQANCNIVPLLVSALPSMDNLPEDMRKVCLFNGVKWIHDYQDACIDRLERFLKQGPFVNIDMTQPFLTASLKEGKTLTVLTTSDSFNCNDEDSYERNKVGGGGDNNGGTGGDNDESLQPTLELTSTPC